MGIAILVEGNLKRVLILSRERPLLAGVEGLLKKEPDISLSSISTMDVNTLAQEFELEQPEVIIVDDSFPATELAALLNLLPACTELRLVVLSNTENKLAVYEKREIQVNQSADLIATVRNGH